MTQKRQWLLFGAILGVGALATWALVRWGGLAGSSPKTPPRATVIKPTPQAPKPTQQAVLPFNNGKAAGGAAIPKFGNENAGGAEVPFHDNRLGGAAVPVFGSDPTANAAPQAKTPINNEVAVVPAFGNISGTPAGDTSPGPPSSLAGSDNKTSSVPVGAGVVPQFTQYPNEFNVPIFDFAGAIVEHDIKCPIKFAVGLAFDGRGRLWAASDNEGIWVYDRLIAEEARRWKQSLEGTFTCVLSDRLGRIWAGTRSDGIFVFNGSDWHGYDALTGPLGNHVSAMACSPLDGDVWIATDAGLARYSQSTEKWQYVTVADGLPANEIQALAFGQDGTLYVATQCEGLAIASLADKYTSWRVVRCNSRLATTGTGVGLPSKKLNCVIVSTNGSVYAGTAEGLARSNDRGLSWSYIRGRDYVDKLNRQSGGPPPGWKAPTPNELVKQLSEDYVSCIAEDNKGRIIVGHWRRGYEVLDSSGSTVLYNIDDDTSLEKTDRYVSCILAGSNRSTYIAQFGAPVVQFVKGANVGSGPAETISRSYDLSESLIPWPKNAELPTLNQLRHWREEMYSLEEERNFASFIGDDWITAGDWAGRYGRYYAVLAGASGAWDDEFWSTAILPDSLLESTMGPTHKSGDNIRRWVASLKTADEFSLYDPTIGYRRQAEWDDHGEAYSTSAEGPDIWLNLKVPEGLFRWSLYFYNDDGHVGRNRNRDLLLELRRMSATGGYSECLAQARVNQFTTGIYKQFLVAGPDTYQIRVLRGGSINATCCGSFLDRMVNLSEDERGARITSLTGSAYGPRQVGDESVSVTLADREGMACLKSFDYALGRTQGAIHERAIGVQLYRYLLQSQSIVAEQLRWRLQLPSLEDNVAYHLYIDEAWRAYRMSNPQLNRKGNP